MPFLSPLKVPSFQLILCFASLLPVTGLAAHSMGTLGGARCPGQLHALFTAELAVSQAA